MGYKKWNNSLVSQTELHEPGFYFVRRSPSMGGTRIWTLAEWDVDCWGQGGWWLCGDDDPHPDQEFPEFIPIREPQERAI